MKPSVTGIPHVKDPTSGRETGSSRETTEIAKFVSR